MNYFAEDVVLPCNKRYHYGRVEENARLEGREARYSGGKTDGPCSFGHETPVLLLAHITTLWRWGSWGDIVKLE